MSKNIGFSVATRVLGVSLSVFSTVSTASTVAHSAESTAKFFSAPAPAPLVAAVSSVPMAGAILPTVLLTSKDWRLIDLGTSCVATTTAALDAINHHLEIKVAKAQSPSIEISIRAEATSTSHIGFKAILDRAKTQVYAFTKLSSPTETVFWNIPRGSEALINYLKREMKLDAQSFDQSGLPSKSVVFSLRGSSAVLSELGKKCSAGLSVPAPTEMAFERAFLPQSVANVDLARITPARADALKAQLEIGRLAFLDSAATQSQIESLNARFLREINELAGLRRNLDRLTQQEVKRLETERANAQAAIQSATQDIQTLRPQLSVIESQLVTANAEYEAAYNRIAPNLPEYNRLVAEVRNQENRQSDAQAQLSRAESQLRQAQTDLRNLEIESANLRNAYSSAQSEEQQARNDYQRDAQAVRNFDRNRELRDRLSRDGRIDRLEREVQQFDARIRAQQQALAQQEAERNRLNQELLNCRQQAGRDCSAEQQRLVEAQRRFQEIRQGIQVLESNRNSKVQEISSVRNQIEADVDRQLRQLEQEQAASRQRLNNAQMRLRDLENRMQSIDRVEIPARQNDVRRFDSDRANAAQDLSSATRRLNQARQDLESFRRSTGFDVLKEDVDRKLSRVNELKSDLARIDREIRRREKVIDESQKALARIATEMEAVLEQIKLKEARSIEVQRALQPYEQEKAILDAKKASSDQALAQAQAQFVANL